MVVVCPGKIVLHQWHEVEHSVIARRSLVVAASQHSSSRDQVPRSAADQGRDEAVCEAAV